MQCECCGVSTIQKKVRRMHWLKGQLTIVENVPAEVCPECGERYFHATVLDEIDALLVADHPVQKRLEVEVVAL